MKKFFSIVIILLFTISILMVSAKQLSLEEVEELKDQAGILPDNPLYDFKRAGEEISLAFTLDKKKKADKTLEIADKKVIEMKIMNSLNKSKAFEKVSKIYEKTMNKFAKEVGLLKSVQNDPELGLRTIIEFEEKINSHEKKVLEIGNEFVKNNTHSIKKIISSEKEKVKKNMKEEHGFTEKAIDETEKEIIKEKETKQLMIDANNAIIKAEKKIILAEELLEERKQIVCLDVCTELKERGYCKNKCHYVNKYFNSITGKVVDNSTNPGFFDVEITSIILYNKTGNHNIGTSFLYNITYQVIPTIINLGTKDIDLTKLYFSVGHDGEGINALGECKETTIILKQGESIECDTANLGGFGISSSGEHNVTVKIDYNNYYSESDESNNELTLIFNGETGNEEYNETNNNITNSNTSVNQNTNQVQNRVVANNTNISMQDLIENCTLWTGYIYNNELNECELKTKETCRNPFEFNTKELCEKNNIKENNNNNDNENVLERERTFYLNFDNNLNSEEGITPISISGDAKFSNYAMSDKSIHDVKYNEYFEYDCEDVFNPDEGTVQAWISFSNFGWDAVIWQTDDSKYAFYYERGSKTSYKAIGARAFGDYYDSNDVKYYFDKGDTPIDEPNTWNNNEWHFVVMTWNYEHNSNIKLYIDGELVEQGTGSIPSYCKTFRIGNNYWPGLSWDVGYIDELEVYNYERSAEEIKQSFEKFNEDIKEECDDEDDDDCEDEEDEDEKEYPAPCGEGDRITICHITGTTDFKTITIDKEAVQAHINHGDYCGECIDLSKLKHQKIMELQEAIIAANNSNKIVPHLKEIGLIEASKKLDKAKNELKKAKKAYDYRDYIFALSAAEKASLYVDEFYELI